MFFLTHMCMYMSNIYRCTFSCARQSWSQTVNSRTHRGTFRFISILHEWQTKIIKKYCKLFTESILRIYCLLKLVHIVVCFVQIDSILINCFVILKQIYGSKIAFHFCEACIKRNKNLFKINISHLAFVVKRSLV